MKQSRKVRHPNEDPEAWEYRKNVGVRKRPKREVSVLSLRYQVARDFAELRGGARGARLLTSMLREEPEFEGPETPSGGHSERRPAQRPPVAALPEPTIEDLEALTLDEQLCEVKESLERGERVPTSNLEGVLLLRATKLIASADPEEQVRGEKILLSVYGKRASPKLLEIEAKLAEFASRMPTGKLIGGASVEDHETAGKAWGGESPVVPAS